MISVITFENVSEAMACESALLKEDIKVKLIPAPRSLSASCGISAKINPEDKIRVLEILDKSKIEYEGCYDME